MHQGNYVFSQFIDFISQYTFQQCVEEFRGDYRVRTLSCWQQFLVMIFGQFSKRESLRDICICLTAHKAKLYHLGLPQAVQRTTLQDANERRDYRIYESFACKLIVKARKLYAADEIKTLPPELADDIVYALDSTTVGLSLTLFPWADFRSTKSGIKAHVLLDLRGNIPSFIVVTDAAVADVGILDSVEFEAGAFYIMDRGYLDFVCLYLICLAKAFFVIRAKRNTKLRRVYSRIIAPEELRQGVRCDQTVVFTGYEAQKNYPQQLRRIKYYDAKTNHRYVFLTNNFTLSAFAIAELYRNRWQVEIFFKWIKQHLKIQSFWGCSENAVKTQIWVAIASYALVAIVKKQLALPHSMYEILQILSVSVFDKTPLKTAVFST